MRLWKGSSKSGRYLFSGAETSLAKTIRVLCDGPEVFPTFLAAVDAAQRKVSLEIYHIADDETGRTVRDALVGATKRGCEVRIIFDCVGSFPIRQSFFAPIAEAGGRILEYHSLLPWRRNWSWIKRDHRKMLIVDDDYCLIGGLNISNTYRKAPPDGGYHDLAVEVRGPIVQRAHFVFHKTWIGQTGEFSELPRPEELDEHDTRDMFPAQLVANDRFRDRWRIRRAILYACAQAKETIDIVNPYFLPTPAMIHTLQRAVGRGARVRIIVPSRSDVPIIDLASAVVLQRLRRRGVQIFLWPGVIHAKAALVDGTWFTIGSYNFDYQSLFRNLEIMVMATRKQCGQRLLEIVERDIQISTPLTPEHWLDMPWLTRQVARLLYRLRAFL